MCNLICWILVMPAYDSQVIHSDAAIGLLPHYLLPMILYHMVPMLMHVMAIILEMQR